MIRRDTYTGIPVLGPGTEESWIHFHIDGKEGMMMMYSEYSEYSVQRVLCGLVGLQIA